MSNRDELLPVSTLGTLDDAGFQSRTLGQLAGTPPETLASLSQFYPADHEGLHRRRPPTTLEAPEVKIPLTMSRAQPPRGEPVLNHETWSMAFHLPSSSKGAYIPQLVGQNTSHDPLEANDHGTLTYGQLSP